MSRQNCYRFLYLLAFFLLLLGGHLVAKGMTFDISCGGKVTTLPNIPVPDSPKVKVICGGRDTVRSNNWTSPIAYIRTQGTSNGSYRWNMPSDCLGNITLEWGVGVRWQDDSGILYEDQGGGGFECSPLLTGATGLTSFPKKVLSYTSSALRCKGTPFTVVVTTRIIPSPQSSPSWDSQSIEVSGTTPEDPGYQGYSR